MNAPALDRLTIAFLIIWGAIVFVAIAHGAEYTTYAGDKFVYRHYGEMDNIFIDTIRVLSVTVRGDALIVRTVDSEMPLIIKPPDRLEAINGRP